MAFVPATFDRLRLAVAGQRKSLEIIHARDASFAEYLEIFLCHRTISICEIQQIRQRSVLKGDGDGYVIAVVASGVRQGRGGHRPHWAAHNSSRPIDKMTQLANDPSPIARVLNPTGARDEPSVAADMYHHWIAAAGEESHQPFREGREAAIKSHHEKWRAILCQRFGIRHAHHLQLLAVYGKRFLDKHGFPLLERAFDVSCVAVMPGKNEGRVHIGIGK